MVLPEGLQANWSCIIVWGSASLIQFVTKNVSASLHNIGVTEIGRNYLKFVGQSTLGTDVTTALSHCAGTNPEVKE